MIYKKLFINSEGIQIYGRFDNDGLCRLTCTENYPEFQAWLAEGNTPLLADTPE